MKLNINWQTEPAAIIGLTKAALEVAAGAGLEVSDHTTAAIVAGVTSIVTVLATFLVRSQVTSPATDQRLREEKQQAVEQLKVAQQATVVARPLPRARQARKPAKVAPPAPVDASGRRRGRDGRFMKGSAQ